MAPQLPTRSRPSPITRAAPSPSESVAQRTQSQPCQARRDFSNLLFGRPAVVFFRHDKFNARSCACGCARQRCSGSGRQEPAHRNRAVDELRELLRTRQGTRCNTACRRVPRYTRSSRVLRLQDNGRATQSAYGGPSACNRERDGQTERDLESAAGLGCTGSAKVVPERSTRFAESGEQCGEHPFVSGEHRECTSKAEPSVGYSTTQEHSNILRIPLPDGGIDPN
jgi:hypothetical protein